METHSDVLMSQVLIDYLV